MLFRSYSPIFHGLVPGVCDFLQWRELLVWVPPARSSRLFESSFLVGGAVDCYVDFGDNSVKCALSVDNSSTGNCPNWGAHLSGGIPLLASWEAPLFLVNFALEVESTAFYILRVHGLLLLRDGPWCGLHPLHLDGELGQRTVVIQ